MILHPPDLHVMKKSVAREHALIFSSQKSCSRLLFGKSEGNLTNYKMTTSFCSLSFLIHVLYDGDIFLQRMMLTVSVSRPCICCYS